MQTCETDARKRVAAMFVDSAFGSPIIEGAAHYGATTTCST
jgi:hypothetical protein